MNVSLVTQPDGKNCSVSVSGEEIHVITDEERTTFGLSDEQLKQAVAKALGKTPNDVYVRSPTPWDDLYKRYGWLQVTTNIVPFSGEILGIAGHPTILKTTEFKNSTSVAAKFNVSISESVEDTSTSTWTTGGKFTVGSSITYSAKFLGIGVEGTTSMSYEQSWGKGESHSLAHAVGSSTGVEIELKPGQAVQSVLSSTRGVMTVRVTYKSSLSGGVIANYNPTYNGHHFYWLPAAHVMAAANISNSITSIENVEIDYYSNSKLEVKDSP